jgi:hypothetical protein
VARGFWFTGTVVLPMHKAPWPVEEHEESEQVSETLV